MDRQCSCGRSFTAKPGPGRPRRKCEVCSPPEPRRASAPSLSRPVSAVPLQEITTTSADSGPRSVVEATAHALETAGRAETPLGAIALQLARTMMEGGHTASGLAALSKELRGALIAALDGAQVEVDLVDELRERRERRRGA